MKILVGDIGGTNTRLALFDGQTVEEIANYRNVSLGHPSEAVEEYMMAHGPFDAACFGVAGPVVNQAIQMMNVGWYVERDALQDVLNCPVRLVNDFHAQAFAAPHLSAGQVVPLDKISDRQPGHIALIGAGTGLGEALSVWNGSSYFAVAGEGGHSRFGPRDDRQLKVLLGLRERWPDHVSVERVASGPGILNTYDVLRGDAPRHPSLENGDPSAAITRLAMARECSVAQAALEVFVDVLADEAASLALKCNAHLVLVSGGVPPRILPVFEERFRVSFENKGRYRSLMEGIPVRVVTEPNFGLLGAGYAGLELV